MYYILGHPIFAIQIKVPTSIHNYVSISRTEKSDVIWRRDFNVCSDIYLNITIAVTNYFNVLNTHAVKLFSQKNFVSP